MCVVFFDVVLPLFSYRVMFFATSGFIYDQVLVSSSGLLIPPPCF